MYWLPINKNCIDTDLDIVHLDKNLDNHLFVMETDPSLVDTDPSLADMGPCLEDRGPCLLHIGPCLAGVGPFLEEHIFLMGSDLSLVEIFPFLVDNDLFQTDGAPFLVDNDLFQAGGAPSLVVGVVPSLENNGASLDDLESSPLNNGPFLGDICLCLKGTCPYLDTDLCLMGICPSLVDGGLFQANNGPFLVDVLSALEISHFSHFSVSMAFHNVNIRLGMPSVLMKQL